MKPVFCRACGIKIVRGKICGDCKKASRKVMKARHWGF